MLSVEQSCIDIYGKNMTYIKSIDLNLYNKIKLLNNAIEDGLYLERYALEYIDKSFNIKLLNSNTYLYENIHKDANTRLYEIKNKPKSFCGIKTVDIPKNYVVSKDISKGVMEPFYPFIEHIEKHTSDKAINNLNKFIFFGCGLARHIELFIKSYKPKIVMIEENDLEIFRLSLFVTNYKDLSTYTDLIFSVMNSDLDNNKCMHRFMDEFSFYNYSIGFEALNDENIANINKYLNYIASSDNAEFPVSGLLFSLQRHVNLISNSCNRFINFKQDYPILYDLPTLVLAPGPSLIKNISWLQKSKDKFFIIALGAALKTLYKFNIKPDAIINVDPNLIIMNQFDGIPIKYFDDIILISSTNTRNEVLELFKPYNILYIQVFYDLIGQPFFAGKSVGDALINILLLLEFRNIYLLGADLAIDDITGASHTKGHIHYKEHNTSKIFDINNKIFNNEDLMGVDGNFTDKVVTTRFFNSVKELYEKHIRLNSTKDTRIYNLSNGAKIIGTYPLDTNSINLTNILNKEHIKKEILENLSLIECDLDNRNSMDFKVLEALLCSLNETKLKKYDNFNSVMEEKLNTSIQLKEMARDNKIDKVLFELILSFEKLTDPYFFKFISIKDNQKDLYSLQHLMMIWIDLLIQIVVKYIDIIKSYKDK